MLVLLVDSNKDMFHPTPTLKNPRKHPLSVYLFSLVIILILKSKINFKNILS